MSNTADEKKKISLKEVMQQQLAKKKEAQGKGKQTQNAMGSTQKMKDQQHKKPSNTRRKMGS